nr:MAG TPA: hypothetical protein [Bacteriophage sp.]
MINLSIRRIIPLSYHIISHSFSRGFPCSFIYIR